MLSRTRLYFFVFPADHRLANKFVSVHARDADYAQHVMRERYNGEWTQMFSIEEWLLHRGEFTAYTLHEEVEMPLNFLARIIGVHNREIGLEGSYMEGQPCYTEATILLRSMMREGWILVKEKVHQTNGDSTPGQLVAAIAAAVMFF